MKTPTHSVVILNINDRKTIMLCAGGKIEVHDNGDHLQSSTRPQEIEVAGKRHRIQSSQVSTALCFGGAGGKIGGGTPCQTWDIFKHKIDVFTESMTVANSGHSISGPSPMEHRLILVVSTVSSAIAAMVVCALRFTPPLEYSITQFMTHQTHLHWHSRLLC